MPSVLLQPLGRRTEIEAGETLLDAAQAVGAGLISLCGGEGWCHSCRVRLIEGALNPPTEAEIEALGEGGCAEGYRLACRAIPRGEVRIEIPPDSLSASQRLQLEGAESMVAVDPPVVAVDLRLPPPNLADPRSDATRLQEGLTAQGHSVTLIGWPVLHELSSRLRAADWACRAALRGGEVVAVLPPGERLAGLAVDLGTTKLAAFLIDLTSGKTLARAGAMNPQIAYGEDVISRIAYCGSTRDGRRKLQESVVEALNGLVQSLADESGVRPEAVVQAVVVGNTAMHHLFAGLPVEQLGLAPYVPAVASRLSIPARDLGLKISPGAVVDLLPNVAGYVGADHIAVLLATDLWRHSGTACVADIGTNTEITLAARGRLLTCSCASGPAFEGAHIRDGMRAALGAIEGVRIRDGRPRVAAVGGGRPVGLCGSGILDAVAEMRAAGILDEGGAMRPDAPGVRARDGSLEYLLVEAGDTGHGSDIVVTVRDVREVQLGKAAIRTGLEALLTEAQIQATDLEAFLLAGAFGSYIHVPSAIRIGMLPDLPLERFRPVGNAAGAGARQALISQASLASTDEIAERIEYIELTTYPEFQDLFLASLRL